MPLALGGVILKEADSNTEKKLLGVLDDQSKYIGHGKINLQIFVRDGRMERVEIIESRKSIKLDD